MSKADKPALAQVPPISDALADYLKATWPAKCFNPSEQSDLQAARYGGIHAAAQWLLEAHEFQRKPEEDTGLDPDAQQASKEPY